MKIFNQCRQKLTYTTPVKKNNAPLLFKSKGFTLIEMLIAVSISALVAALAYATFDAASRNAGRTQTILSDINRVDRAWQIITQDMRNMIVPNPRYQQVYPLMAASQKTIGSNAFQVIMQFERSGWANPLGRQRSDLQLVNYRIAEGKLFRDFLPQLNFPMQDTDFERESAHQELLKGVKDIQLRFLTPELVQSLGKGALLGEDYSKAWDTAWPSPDHPGSGFPIAVEISLDVEKVGRCVRLFELPQI